MGGGVGGWEGMGLEHRGGGAEARRGCRWHGGFPGQRRAPGCLLRACAGAGDLVRGAHQTTGIGATGANAEYLERMAAASKGLLVPCVSVSDW